MPTSPYFPLRWESTGDQWWYATPIDWAAANGLSDLVKHLLRVDPDLLIKLTSLRRIRRLESVWDDPDPTNGVAGCRAHVARVLLSDCESKGGSGAGENSLIRAGYGGWLLYTAASAGDVGFVKELVEEKQVSVFGEGEYGITDILYAAARSKNAEVFRFMFEFAVNLVKSNEGGGKGSGWFLWEMMNRAVHAAARGGSLEILKELLGDCSAVLAYRDAQGSTILHSAASRGQIQVVKYLIATYGDMMSSVDNQGNTALHIAAYRGYYCVLEALAHVSPSLSTLRNNNGDTLLHLAVEGFRSPGFHRIDLQIDLMKQLVSDKILCLKHLINIRNAEGRTALHSSVAQSRNIELDVVQLLMSVPSIDLNILDVDGFTPLDLLRQHSKTPTSEILIKQVASAGGISFSGYQYQNDKNTLKSRGIGGSSPGTCFRFPDAELCNGNDNNSEVSCEMPSSRFSSCSSEPTTSYLDSPSGLDQSRSDKRLNSKRFKLFPSWSMKSSKGEGRNIDMKDIPTPLREKFARDEKESYPSPCVKERFGASLMQGVIQATPPKSCFSSSGRYGSFSKLRGGDHRETNNAGRSMFFSGPLDGVKSRGNDEQHRRVGSFNKSLMNQYFCFGAQGLAVKDSLTYTHQNPTCRKLLF